jgi:hypothetical protein
MKIDAGTLAKEEIKQNKEIDNNKKIKIKAFKSLKPLFLPNIHKQILFQKVITLHSNKKNISAKQFLNNSLIIDNCSKKKYINNKSFSTRKNINNKKKNSSIKIINNRSIFNKILPLNEIDSIYFDNIKRNNVESKDIFNVRCFKSIISNNAFDLSNSALSDKKMINKNFVCLKRNIKNIKPRYLFNNFKCNNDNLQRIDKKINEENENKARKRKILKKGENQVRYYKWFI